MPEGNPLSVMGPVAQVAESEQVPLLEEDGSIANGQEADTARRLDVLLHEYKTLRAEILARTTSDSNLPSCLAL